MTTIKAIPEEILLLIQNLPQESLRELAIFLEYLQYKNSLKKNQDNKTIQEPEIEAKTTITASESEKIIEEMLREVSNSLPSLSDYAVSRASIYEDHP
ncbi:MAG: hypothetical protein QNJ54_18520 [Prochloraceae cyanobacterium]|nr:hypothetical protein [Prochloraceae cyanobacterium]